MKIGSNTFVEDLTTKEFKLFAPDEFIFRSEFDVATATTNLRTYLHESG
jgi:hypothetical protein